MSDIARRYRETASLLPEGSGLRVALLVSARRIETGDTSPVTLRIVP